MGGGGGSFLFEPLDLFVWFWGADAISELHRCWAKTISISFTFYIPICLHLLLSTLAQNTYIIAQVTLWQFSMSTHGCATGVFVIMIIGRYSIMDKPQTAKRYIKFLGLFFPASRLGPAHLFCYKLVSNNRISKLNGVWWNTTTVFTIKIFYYLSIKKYAFLLKVLKS